MLQMHDRALRPARQAVADVESGTAPAATDATDATDAAGEPAFGTASESEDEPQLPAAHTLCVITCDGTAPEQGSGRSSRVVTGLMACLCALALCYVGLPLLLSCTNFAADVGLVTWVISLGAQLIAIFAVHRSARSIVCALHAAVMPGRPSVSSSRSRCWREFRFWAPLVAETGLRAVVLFLLLEPVQKQLANDRDPLPRAIATYPCVVMSAWIACFTWGLRRVVGAFIYVYRVQAVRRRKLLNKFLPATQTRSTNMVLVLRREAKEFLQQESQLAIAVNEQGATFSSSVGVWIAVCIAALVVDSVSYCATFLLSELYVNAPAWQLWLGLGFDWLLFVQILWSLSRVSYQQRRDVAVAQQLLWAVEAVMDYNVPEVRNNKRVGPPPLCEFSKLYQQTVQSLSTDTVVAIAGMRITPKLMSKVVLTTIAAIVTMCNHVDLVAHWVD